MLEAKFEENVLNGSKAVQENDLIKKVLKENINLFKTLLFQQKPLQPLLRRILE